MKRADDLLLHRGTSQQEFDFRIPFLQVDCAHHRIQVAFGQRPTPHIDCSAITAGCPFEVSVVQGIDNGRMPGMNRTPRTLNHKFR